MRGLAQKHGRLETIPEAEIEMSYDDYQHNLESIDREFKANGLKYELVPVDIDLMTAWCHCNGLKIDSKGRATYGAVLASSRKDPTALTKPKEPASDGDGMSISKALRDVLDANGMSADDFAAAFERCMSCTRG